MLNDTSRFLAEQLCSTATDALDAKLAMVEARLQEKLLEIQMKATEDRSQMQQFLLSSRIAAMMTCLESLNGKKSEPGSVSRNHHRL